MNMKTIADFLNAPDCDPINRERVIELCDDLGVDHSMELDTFVSIPSVAVRSHLVIGLNYFNEESAHE